MDRKELYKIIKDNDLAEEIKKKYGDNYTRVSSKNLNEFITVGWVKSLNECTCEGACNCASEVKENALIKLLSILAAKGIIIPEEAEMVAKLL